MPSELPPKSVLLDILIHIDLAADFLRGQDVEQFAEDKKSYHAVVRCLEIVSEASRRLPDDLKARHPEIAWSKIAGAGNIYRHDYEDVIPQIVWSTVVLALPSLRRIVAEELNETG